MNSEQTFAVEQLEDRLETLCVYFPYPSICHVRVWFIVIPYPCVKHARFCTG
jgi:hypothetical protein